MTLPSFNLKGKKALVTGARRGIGKTLALALAGAGADVAVADLITDDGELHKTSEEIKALGRNSILIQADTSNQTSVSNMMAIVIKGFGQLDIMVNNAGTNAFSPILELTEADWDRVMNVNLKGFFLCAQAAGKIMVAQNSGAIINTCSQFAFRPMVNLSVYSISKAGVAMLTKSSAKELGGYGVRCNAIAPGMVRTEMTRQSLSNPDFVKMRTASIPLGRFADTTDLTGAVLFLASDASSYINGQIITIDGGEL